MNRYLIKFIDYHEPYWQPYMPRPKNENLPQLRIYDVVERVVVARDITAVRKLLHITKEHVIEYRKLGN